MASVESSIFYERQPYLGRSSSKIMERLDSEKGLLKYKEKKLEKLPTLLKTRQTAAEKQEALFNNQSKSDADRDRFKRDRRANMLREVKEMQILLPKEIEEVKEKIKSLEGELAEAEAREEAIAAKVNPPTDRLGHISLTKRREQPLHPISHSRRSLVILEMRKLRRSAKGLCPENRLHPRSGRRTWYHRWRESR